MGNRKAQEMACGIAKKKEIETLFASGDYPAAKELFDAFYEQYCDNFEWIVMKAAFLYSEGQFKEARDLLEKHYDLHRLHYECNYNLGMICFELQDYEAAMRYLIRSLYLPENEEHKDLAESAMQTVEQICRIDAKFVAEIGKISDEVEYDHKRIQDAFPVKTVQFEVGNSSDQMKTGTVLCDEEGNKAHTGNGISETQGCVESTYIGDYFTDLEGIQYYSGVYDSYYPERDEIESELFVKSRALFQTETVPGQKQKEKVLTFEQPVTVTLPVMVFCNHQLLQMNEYELTHMLPNRFYYYTLEHVTDIVLSSEAEFVLGEPVIHGRKKEKPNVLVNIFVDGLSQQLINEYGLEKLMPNTARFFQEGCICEEGFANGEWTFPSLASFFTGLPTRYHGMYHSCFRNPNLWKLPLVTETLKKEGYVCSRFDGDWRSTPTEGYSKGMHRQIYQEATRSMKAEDTVSLAISQLAAFKDTPQFVWIGIPDLHDAADEYEMSMEVQVNERMEDRILQHTNQTSVLKHYDRNKIYRYIAQLKRIDRILENLYHYILVNYDEDDFVVGLMSDHGQGFLAEEGAFFMDEHRSHIPMMFRGGHIKKGICSELMESTDYFPAMLSGAGICWKGGMSNLPQYFGGTSSREYVYTESIHENRRYQGAIFDKEYAFFFSSREFMRNDESIDMKDYEIHLIRRKDKKDCTGEQKKLVEKYENIMLERMEEYIINI